MNKNIQSCSTDTKNLKWNWIQQIFGNFATSSVREKKTVYVWMSENKLNIMVVLKRAYVYKSVSQRERKWRGKCFHTLWVESSVSPGVWVGPQSAIRVVSLERFHFFWGGGSLSAEPCWPSHIYIVFHRLPLHHPTLTLAPYVYVTENFSYHKAVVMRF